MLAVLFMVAMVEFFRVYYEPIVGNNSRIPYSHDPLTTVFLTAMFAIFTMALRSYLNKNVIETYTSIRAPFSCDEKSFVLQRSKPTLKDIRYYRGAMLAQQTTISGRSNEYLVLIANAVYLLNTGSYGYLEAFDILSIVVFSLCSIWLMSATEFRYNIPSNRKIIEAEESGGKWVIEDRNGRRVTTHIP